MHAFIDPVVQLLNLLASGLAPIGGMAFLASATLTSGSNLAIIE